MTRPERRSVDVPGHGHGDLPIPSASRVGDLIATGGVRGVERATGDIPTDPRRQVDFMFENLAAIVDAAGGAADTILKVTVFVKTPEIRALINPAWERLFPDPERRPARHVLDQESLKGRMVVQCEALAVARGPIE